MSMLAEKKRREKWSLNPRGKAWSEDKNKFGQQLMEKMGWKSGQGLGVNSQGQTDIVKTRVKNDSKGLGFKENGEEWLKTTSDFDNLLDELASSKEDSGDGSQTETLASLEDRSKKSRSRVHYQKFTRGKDISRYSEKDLASIIGPDVIKLKNEQESKSDYTQNQVNKGSLEEYFSKKLKSKGRKSTDNVINGEISDDLKETVINSKNELRSLHEDSGNMEIDLESEVAVSSKKKKKKNIFIDQNVAEVNNSLDHVNCQVEDNQHYSETEVLGKKNKKIKSGCDVGNISKELEENDPNGLNSATSDVCQTHDVPSKKRKRKNEDYSQDEENSACLDNTKSQTECNTDEKTVKKKKRKIKAEETVQCEYSDNYANNSSLVSETVVTEETVTKKKKKKSRDENKEHQEDPADIQTDCNEECSTSNPVIAEESVINDSIISKKKKKSKDKNREYQDGPSEVQTEHNVKFKSNNPIVSEKTVVDGLVSKKKKKTEVRNKELQEEPLGEEQLVLKKKSKQEKEGKPLYGDSTNTVETAAQCEQVVSHKKSGDFLEVLGRRTRLKNIKNIHKPTDNSYETEDFMLFCKTDNSKKEVAKEENSLPLITKDVDNKCVYIYRESNPLDCSITKDLLSYENKLVTNKLSKLKTIKRPSIVITDSQNLNKSVVKKLEEVHRVRYYKEFLSEQDISEINAAVKEFGENRTNSKVATSKDDNQNSEKTKTKPVLNKIEKKNKTTVKRLGTTRNNPKIATEQCVNNSKLATSEEIRTSVNNEKDNYFKCYAEATDDCDVPKHVVAYEYRLVAARLKQLEITQPEVKVVVKDSNTLNETTKRKLRQIAKIKHLKTLFPPDDLTEIEALVTKFYDNLKPKIEIMTKMSELEEKILEAAENLDGKPELKLDQKEDVEVKRLSEQVEAMTDLFQKLETLIESFNTSEDTTKENPDAEDEGEQSETRFAWLNKVKDKLDIFKKHIKMLAQAKIPPDLNTNRESQIKHEKEQSQKFNSNVDKNHQNRSYSRGRIAHHVDQRGRGRGQRGRGRGIGRSQSVAKSAVPSGGWGVLKSYGSGAEPGLVSGSQNYRGSFSDGGRFIGRGRGFSDRGGFLGRGRGFSGVGRGGLSLRGWGRGDMRGRGRISQNNFDAKLYADRCKELNKVPVVCFNGVNMKVISGYPANANEDKNNTSSHGDSKSLGNLSSVPAVISTKESVAAVNTTNVPGGFSEVVVRTDGQSVDREQGKIPNRPQKGVMKKKEVSTDSFNKKETSDAKVT